MPAPRGCRPCSRPRQSLRRRLRERRCSRPSRARRPDHPPRGRSCRQCRGVRGTELAAGVYGCHKSISSSGLRLRRWPRRSGRRNMPAGSTSRRRSRPADSVCRHHHFAWRGGLSRRRAGA